MAVTAIPLLSGQVVDEFGVVRDVQRAFLNATGSGNTQIVPSQGAALRVRVLAATIVSLTALTIKFQSATTDIASGKPVAANGGFVVPLCDHGWCQTAVNEDLNVNLSGAGTVGVDLVWVQAG